MHGKDLPQSLPMPGLRECPKCEKISPPGTETCDCGYEFDAGPDKVVNKQTAKGLRRVGLALLLSSGLLFAAYSYLYLLNWFQRARSWKLVLSVLLFAAGYKVFSLLRYRWRTGKFF